MPLVKKYQWVLTCRLLADSGRCQRGGGGVDFFVVVAGYCCFLFCEVPYVQALGIKLKG